MSVYNRQNQEFVPLAETSGILQNMTSSNIEYVVCADGETPELNTGIRLSPSKKLKFSQTVGVSYVRVVGNTTGDIIVTPNDEASSGGGGSGSEYTLPIATENILGGVKIGSGIDVQPDGTISVTMAPNNDIVTWVGGTSYKAGQYVIYNNNLYECLEDNEDNTFDETKWQIIGGNGGSFDILDWVSGTEYAVGDLVMYNHVLYQCTTANNDTEFDREKWTSIGELESDLQEWKTNTSYRVGNFVIKDNKLYKCTEANRDNVFNADHWQEIGDMSNIEQWISGEEYAVGEYVIYDNRVYECTTANNDTVFDVTKWNDIGSIQSYVQQWQPNTEYSLGDLVIKDNAIYKCTTANEDSTFDVTKWEKIIDNDKSLTAWEGGKKYNVGQYVVYENKIYECAIANRDTVFDAGKWTLINEPTGLVLDTWKTRKQYKKNQVVEYLGDMYMCLIGHNSDVFKDDYDNGMWLKVDHSIPAYTYPTFYPKDSVVSYEGKLLRCLVSHSSSNDSPFNADLYSKSWWSQDSDNVLCYSTSRDGTMARMNTPKSIDLDLSNEFTSSRIGITTAHYTARVHFNDISVYVSNDNTNFESVGTVQISDYVGRTYTFDFPEKTFRYIRIGASGATPWDTNIFGFYSGWTIVSKVELFQDNSNKWEILGGSSMSSVQQWQPNTEYLANNIVYSTNGLYICKSDYTSGADFFTDLLAGKWEWVGKEGVNNVTQTTLYSGNDKVSTMTSYTISETLTQSSYDYILVQLSGFGSSQGFATGGTCILSWNTNQPTPSWYGAYIFEESSSATMQGVILINGNTLNFSPASNSTVSYQCIDKVIGIKLNTLTTSDIAEMAMPSDVYTTIPLSATTGYFSGATNFTAPANGWVEATVVPAESKAAILITNISPMGGGFGGSYRATSLVPVKKNDAITIYMEGGTSSSEAKFYYSVGDAKALGLI